MPRRCCSDADKQVPGFAETAQARAEIASLRTERGQRYRERYQYAAAIDQAFASEQLWEAERLLADYAQRFNQDDEYRARSDRLAQMRAAGPYQARVNEARAHIATARQAMDRNDFVEAERQLALADRSAPGFPEIGQARADLSRRRIAAEKQQDDLRLILGVIDAAFQRRQFDDADRAIEDGRRRYRLLCRLGRSPEPRCQRPSRRRPPGQAICGRRMRARSSWLPPRGAARRRAISPPPTNR